MNGIAQPLLLYAVFVLSVFGAACSSKPEFGLYPRGEEPGVTFLGFSATGPTIAVPDGWHPIAPRSEERARIERSDADGAQGRCFFTVDIRPEYRGLTEVEVVNQRLSPDALQEEMETPDEDGFSATLEDCEATDLHGHPGWECEWTTSMVHRGIVVPLRMRSVAIGYKEMAIMSACVATEYDFALIRQELDTIQHSFKEFG